MSVKDRINALIAHLNWMSDQSDKFFSERRAECALLGHVSSGQMFMTAKPTHVCYYCLMRYCVGEDFGYVEGR